MTNEEFEYFRIAKYNFERNAVNIASPPPNHLSCYYDLYSVWLQNFFDADMFPRLPL